MTLAINFKDPRYQKKLLEAGAHANANTQGLVSNLTSQFTNQQMGFKMDMRRQALAKQMNRDRVNLGYKELRHKREFFDKEMKTAKRQSDFTTLFGLGTGIYSAIEGNRRRVATEALNEENRVWRRRMEERSIANQEAFAEILRRGTT